MQPRKNKSIADKDTSNTGVKTISLLNNTDQKQVVVIHDKQHVLMAREQKEIEDTHGDIRKHLKHLISNNIIKITQK